MKFSRIIAIAGLSVALFSVVFVGWQVRVSTMAATTDKQANGPAPEVHVVGLYQAASDQHFRLVHHRGEDIDWNRLCATLVAHGKKDEPSPGNRVWSLMKENVRAVALNKDLVKKVDTWAQNPLSPIDDEETFQAMRRLTEGMQEILRRSDFFEEKSFAGVALDDEGKELLQRRKDLNMLESWVLNRRLLEASFPDAVKKSSFTLKKATVPVRVVATKTPITLVLCGYNSVLWEVRPDKGARIEKVIIGGYHLQAVRGTNAPVTFRVYEPKPTREFFYASDKEGENYRNLAAGVRSLTGKEISTFQGRYSYDEGPPFVVGAKE